MFYTGIDPHRRSSVLTTRTAQGERLAQVTRPNDRGLLSEYFAQYPGPHHQPRARRHISPRFRTRPAAVRGR